MVKREGLPVTSAKISTSLSARSARHRADHAEQTDAVARLDLVAAGADGFQHGVEQGRHGIRIGASTALVKFNPVAASATSP
jgi:hypothetical protein